MNSNNKNKKNSNNMSITTIISLFVSLGLIALTTFCIVSSFVMATGISDQSTKGYIWIIMIILFGSAMIVIPYYLIISLVGFILDKVLKKKNIVKEIIIAVLLLLPIFYVLYSAYDMKRETKQRNYTIGDVTAKFPDNFSKYGYSKDIDGNYTMISFGKYQEDSKICLFQFGKHKYDDSKDLISNFKDNCDNNTFVDKGVSLRNAFDTTMSLKTENINGKTWNYYEKQYSKMNYKMYGLVIDNTFYKIEIEDETVNDTTCQEKAQEILKSIQYK